MGDKTDKFTTEGSEQSRPFFARFLEGQDIPKESIMTLKYPSDRDEDIGYMQGNYDPQ